MTLLLIPLLPFIGFLINASVGKRLSKSVSGLVAVAAMVVSFAASLTVVLALGRMQPDARDLDRFC